MKIICNAYKYNCSKSLYDKIKIKTEIMLLGNWCDPLIGGINFIYDRIYEVLLKCIHVEYEYILVYIHVQCITIA